VLQRGGRDPAFRVAPDGAIWLGCPTPAGPTALRIEVRPADRAATGHAYGPGAEWLLDGLPELLGLHDTTFHEDRELRALVAAEPVLYESLRRRPGLRVTRTRLVMHALVPAILEQKVTTGEAYRGWSALVTRYGTPLDDLIGPAGTLGHGVPAGRAGYGGRAGHGVPGVLGLRCPPGPRDWVMIPSWEWHRAGVDDKRARAVIAACRVAARLEATAGLPHAEADRLLQVVPGVGVWTAAETRQRAHGDPDALSVGDLHLSKIVGYALTGERDADDDRMLELLEPYLGHRYRVARLIRAAGIAQPRRAPRFAPLDFRRI
jgi:3-methyladenine DNA glycosylase/8-oxoguanine DNA glycosylase